MRFIFATLQVFLLNIVLFSGLAGLFITNVMAEDKLPSQKSRFQAMGSTLKKQKAQTLISSDSSEPNKLAADQDDENSDDQKEKPYIYFKLHTLVVNLRDERDPEKLVFLTMEVYCKISDPEDKELINTHIAPIKDVIISNSSGLFRQQIQTQQQKKALQTQLTQKVIDRLNAQTGKNINIDLYLTRLLIQ